MKSKLVLYVTLILVVLLVLLNITQSGTGHVKTVKKNIELVDENEKLTTENTKLTTENKKLNAVVDSQATVINEVASQLEALTTNEKPKSIVNSESNAGQHYSLQPIEVSND